MALVLLAAGVWLAGNMIASRSGRALMAARDDEFAAAAQGIRVVQVRATISGIAGAYLALAGCLSSYQYGYVGPTGYNFALSVQMLFGLVIGGMQSAAALSSAACSCSSFPTFWRGWARACRACSMRCC